MPKIKNSIIIEGLTLLFGWIGCLMVDDTIQKSIVQYPNSYKLYQFIQNILHIDNVLTPIFVFLCIIGTLIYIFYKIRD
jgi:hypothetical protein